MVNSWCMRMEAKNSYFKRVAQIGNFKNLPYSVARRHQRLLCGFLQGKSARMLDILGNVFLDFFRLRTLETQNIGISSVHSVWA